LDGNAAGEIKVSTHFHPHRNIPMIAADAYKIQQVLIEVIHYHAPYHRLLVTLRKTCQVGSEFVVYQKKDRISGKRRGAIKTPGKTR
jgi:hypothetical protein